MTAVDRPVTDRNLSASKGEPDRFVADLPDCCLVDEPALGHEHVVGLALTVVVRGELGLGPDQLLAQVGGPDVQIGDDLLQLTLPAEVHHGRVDRLLPGPACAEEL